MGYLADDTRSRFTIIRHTAGHGSPQLPEGGDSGDDPARIENTTFF